MRSPAISFRFKPETILLLKKLAESMDRSAANTIVHLIHSEAQKLKIKVTEQEIQDFLSSSKNS